MRDDRRAVKRPQICQLRELCPGRLLVVTVQIGCGRFWLWV
jgi:hypothetical protein